MLNDTDDAKFSKLALQKLMRNNLPGYHVSYDISYNHNENPLFQLLELSRQKGIQDWGQLFLWLSGLKVAPDWFQEGLLDIAAHTRSIDYLIDFDLKKHVISYKQAIENCQKVLLVAHSQGNFYGNAAWYQVYAATLQGLPINKLRVMGMVSVGTPASHMGAPLFYEGDHRLITRYSTLDSDLIINAYRLIGLTPMAANLTNSQSSPDWLDHSFTDAYLGVNHSRNVIRNQIRQVAYSLETLPFDRQPLNSSALASAGYDPAAQILEVEFAGNGSVYRYYDVPETIYQSLISASSVGGYYNSSIRGQFISRRLY